jgi:glutathione S-transferase
MITLFWCPQTRASRILWLLGEMNEPFEVRLIDIRKPEAKSDPDFASASPMGKVPAIRDTTPNGTVEMADSASIGLYLADRYPAAGLAPAIDDPARGQYLYWMTYTPGVIEPAMMERFTGQEVSRATSGWGNFDTMIEVL